jgi:hypothetical protein
MNAVLFFLSSQEVVFRVAGKLQLLRGRFIRILRAKLCDAMKKVQSRILKLLRHHLLI